MTATQAQTYTFDELTPLAQEVALESVNNGEVEGKLFFESGMLDVQF